MTLHPPREGPGRVLCATTAPSQVRESPGQVPSGSSEGRLSPAQMDQGPRGLSSSWGCGHACVCA